jgi:hypothetical protein
MSGGKMEKTFDMRFQHPFTCIVCGMTGCGKTYLMKQFLKNVGEMVDVPPQRIVWCYAKWQPMYDELINTVKDIEFVKGLPTEVTFNPEIPNMLIIDDLMSSASGSDEVANLFTRGSHHDNVSILYLVQNLFPDGKASRTISLNAHYLIVFKNPRDCMQITTLQSQMYGRKSKRLREAYDIATERPHGYLVIDLKQNQDDAVRLRTCVLLTDDHMIVFPGK